MPDANSIVNAVAPELEAARSLPRSSYLDEAVFEAERAQVVAAGWAPVARVSEVSKPGAYRTLDLFGAPLVVSCDEAGTVRVLSRVCRHRGMLVCEGAGETKGFTCPYHLWRYRLDGSLASAPAMEDSAVFDRTAAGLKVIRSDTWGGWVFANLDGSAPPLAEALSGLAARLAPIAPERLITAEVLTFESPWNWKVMVENFLESYHHIGPHAASLQRTNPGLLTFESEGSDAYTVLENPPADGQHNPFVVAAAFPVTLMFFTEGAAPLGVWYELDQVRRTGFTLRIHLLAPPDFAAEPELVAHYRSAVAAIHAEDIPACMGVQAGVESPLYEPGPLSRLEAPLWRFHRHLQARLGAT